VCADGLSSPNGTDCHEALLQKSIADIVPNDVVRRMAIIWHVYMQRMHVRLVLAWVSGCHAYKPFKPRVVPSWVKFTLPGVSVVSEIGNRHTGEWCSDTTSAASQSPSPALGLTPGMLMRCGGPTLVVLTTFCRFQSHLKKSPFWHCCDALAASATPSPVRASGPSHVISDLAVAFCVRW
jgi:hypothetical protein